MMSHYGEKDTIFPYKCENFYIPSGSVPSAEILVFLNDRFPNSQNIKNPSIADHWFKLDRRKSQIIVHSKQHYKVSFTESLTLKVERDQEKIEYDY
jgi:hypothetical protein